MAATHRLMLSLAALIVAATPLAATPLAAQDGAAATDTTPRRLCWRGRPLPSCEKILITEVAYHRRLAGSGYIYDEVPLPDGSRARERILDLDSHLSWELGLMKNLTRTDAAGGTLMVGTGDGGARVALKGRYRHWIGKGDARIDLSAGAIRGHVRPLVQYPGTDYPIPSAVPAYGVTADATLDVFELVGVSARVELMRGQGRTGSAVYGGVRLGSYTAIVASAVGVAGLAYLIYAISRSDY